MGSQLITTEDLVYRLQKRAEICRQIATRKPVQGGRPGRLSDLLDEAADEIEKLRKIIKEQNCVIMGICS